MSRRETRAILSGRWTLAAGALAALTLAGCSTLPAVAPSAPGTTLSGRLSVRVEAHDEVAARSENAAFELAGDADNGHLDLSTPLGSVLARANWSLGAVVLATPQGERRYADLDALTADVLGESVPIAALFDWLRGRAWPGASSEVEPAHPNGFRQLGWSVDLARFGEGWVVAARTRPPIVTVRAKLDAP